MIEYLPYPIVRLSRTGGRERRPPAVENHRHKWQRVNLSFRGIACRRLSRRRDGPSFGRSRRRQDRFCGGACQGTRRRLPRHQSHLHRIERIPFRKASLLPLRSIQDLGRSGARGARSGRSPFLRRRDRGGMERERPLRLPRRRDPRQDAPSGRRPARDRPGGSARNKNRRDETGGIRKR